MRGSRVILSAVVVPFTLASHAFAQTPGQPGVKLKLSGRVQTQFSTTSVDEAELLAAGQSPSAIPATMFETRRVRLAAEAEYGGWLTGKLEAEFAMARLQLRDAFINFDIDPRLQLRAGQFKKPFGLLQLTSSTTWPMIERGVRIRGLTESLNYHDSRGSAPGVLQDFRGRTVIGEEQELLETFQYQNYDMGASLHGRLGRFGYQAGVFNGTGADRTDDTDGKSYAARITYRLPVELPVTVGGAVSHREFRTASQPAVTTNSGTAFEADLEVGAFRRPGVRFLGELTMGDNLQDSSDQFLGAQGVLAYFVPLAGPRLEGIEVAGRASYGDPRRDTELDEGLLLTPGVNLYFSGRNRLMLNWDHYLTCDRFENENALRAQAQLYF